MFNTKFYSNRVFIEEDPGRSDRAVEIEIKLTPGRLFSHKDLAVYLRQYADEIEAEALNKKILGSI